MPSRTHCIRGLSCLEQAVLALRVWAVRAGMRSCSKGTCWSSSCLAVLHARGYYDSHSISACQEKYVGFAFYGKRKAPYHGTVEETAWAGSVQCTVGKTIWVQSAQCYVRKQGTQHLKGCKIYLLPIFLFLWHCTHPGMFLHNLFLIEIQKKSCTLSLSHRLCAPSVGKCCSWDRGMLCLDCYRLKSFVKW